MALNLELSRSLTVRLSLWYEKADFSIQFSMSLYLSSQSLPSKKVWHYIRARDIWTLIALTHTLRSLAWLGRLYLGFGSVQKTRTFPIKKCSSYKGLETCSLLVQSSLADSNINIQVIYEKFKLRFLLRRSMFRICSL